VTPLLSAGNVNGGPPLSAGNVNGGITGGCGMP
jgi:hypothetical protein